MLQKRHSDSLTSSEVHGSLEKCILACNLHGLDFICCMFGSRYVCPHSHILLFSIVLNFATFICLHVPVQFMLYYSLLVILYHGLCYNKYLTILVSACILRPAFLCACAVITAASQAVSASFSVHFVASKQSRGAVRLINYSFSNFVFLCRILSVNSCVSL